MMSDLHIVHEAFLSYKTPMDCQGHDRVLFRYCEIEVSSITLDMVGAMAEIFTNTPPSFSYSFWKCHFYVRSRSHGA